MPQAIALTLSKPVEDDKDLTEGPETEKPKRKPRAKRSKKPAAPMPALPPASSAVSGIYKVQIFYLAARNTNPKAPVKDALWFATYPIIPRVGDCLFHDGIYYQVERVFLYENMGPGWYADIEVTFYGRR
ncbi:hypothetical protein PN498_13135 [Oscillatoria sp. CS-180]|nr:hypothetical protein [Oscillatoria sp. CS-180]